MLVDHDADRLGRVPRRCEHLERHVTERQALVIVEQLDRKVDRGRLAERDRGTGARRELEVTTEEVGVEVGLDDPLDGEAGGRRVGEVLVDVTLRVDDDGPTRGLVAHEVRGVGETFQVVLLKDHGITEPLSKLSPAVLDPGTTL